MRNSVNIYQMIVDQIVLEQRFSKDRLWDSEWWNQQWVVKLGHNQHFEKNENTTKKKTAEDMANS